MRVCVLGSGSSGNCTYIEHGLTRLLVDAGLRAKEIVSRLSGIGIEPETLSGILISHEHQDHVVGAAALARKFKIPVFISPKALEFSPSSLQHVAHIPIRADVSVQIGAFTITPFSTPHDSVDPLAFSIRAGTALACVVTDVGFVSESIRERIVKTDLLVIESNHDLEMLRTGPYPWSLKQRVMSNHGHLSNEALAFFFREYYGGTERKVMLTHLSKQNNHPQLAYVSASRALEKKGKNIHLHISLQDEISEMLEI